MFNKLFIVLAFAVCFSTISEVSSQSLFKDEKIPKDLLITYEEKGYNSYKLVIKSNGSVTYYPISVNTVKIEGQEVDTFIMSESDRKDFEESQKSEKKNKLSVDQLTQLISDFEKINFFFLPDKHSTADDGCIGPYVSGPNSENIISIQIAGQSRKIVYSSRCNSNITTDLKNLVEKINEAANKIEVKIDESLNVNKSNRKD